MAPVEGNKLIQKAEAIAKEFELRPEQVRKAVVEFRRLMDLGLQKDKQAMTMIPTYVTSVPKGTEKGVYLAVDLGGTNFRVCSVTLEGNSSFTIQQSKAAIPKELMTGDSTALFSFMAAQVGEFVQTHHSEHFLENKEHQLQLGFTFSFPVDQKAINKGYLLRWTKGFDIKDAVGKDVCELLQTQLDILGLPVRVAALVNDTVGTLMARSYTSPGTHGALMGAIFGTGTNGAYVEKLSKITKMTEPGSDFGKYDTSTGEMVVNTEWGSFDNAMKVLPDTPYDRELDKNSVNPGIQMFEKRVSGMFLGEILRHALLAMKRDVSLFSTAHIREDAELNTPWSIDTSVLSHIEGDESPYLSKTKLTVSEQLGVQNISTEEARAIKLIVHAIGKRSARLAAVPIAAVVLSTGKLSPKSATSAPSSLAASAAENIKQGAKAIKAVVTGEPPKADFPPGGSATTEEPIDIGVDGSVVEFYPGFDGYLREALREVEEVGTFGEKRIRIGIAKDGSGVGAALIALVASKVLDKK
ncbi:hypothetical protein EX30DRAFT_353450 [Ascodesmis nigricans]|uniref:Phosphotransferase n=1 Tax=Ascodesmis nigricans TaxID=341454 RepID=A0A4S2N8L8_9PEZI|nr:hypothetical protein EX30DRAFT_353450 [Ascodesmis nigricans]